jgi:hypothetical protein
MLIPSTQGKRKEYEKESKTSIRDAYARVPPVASSVKRETKTFHGYILYG